MCRCMPRESYETAFFNPQAACERELRAARKATKAAAYARRGQLCCVVRRKVPEITAAAETTHSKQGAGFAQGEGLKCANCSPLDPKAMSAGPRVDAVGPPTSFESHTLRSEDRADTPCSEQDRQIETVHFA